MENGLTFKSRVILFSEGKKIKLLLCCFLTSIYTEGYSSVKPLKPLISRDLFLRLDSVCVEQELISDVCLVISDSKINFNQVCCSGIFSATV